MHFQFSFHVPRRLRVGCGLVCCAKRSRVARAARCALAARCCSLLLVIVAMSCWTTTATTTTTTMLGATFRVIGVRRRHWRLRAVERRCEQKRTRARARASERRGSRRTRNCKRRRDAKKKKKNQFFGARFRCLRRDNVFTQKTESIQYTRPGAVKRTLIHFVASEPIVSFQCDLKIIHCDGCGEVSEGDGSGCVLWAARPRPYTF